MCRAKSDRQGWYRCDWGKRGMSTRDIVRTVRIIDVFKSSAATGFDSASKNAPSALADLFQTVFVETVLNVADEKVDLATKAGIARLVKIAGRDLESAVAEAALTADEEAELDDHAAFVKRIGGPDGALGHLVCTLAAAIGDACASMGSIPAAIAEAVGQQVKASTGSALAGKFAQAIVSRWLAVALASLPLADVAMIGFVADNVAVASCPSQQDPKPHPDHHPEVVECAERIAKRVVSAALESQKE